MSELVERLRDYADEPHGDNGQHAKRLIEGARPLLREAADALALRDDKIAALRRAVDDEGPVPKHHRQVIARHRREWPTLWDAIRGLIR